MLTRLLDVYYLISCFLFFFVFYNSITEQNQEDLAFFKNTHQLHFSIKKGYID